MPKLIIIGGPNGSGKTTSSFKILPAELQKVEFVNADNIAADLSPSQPENIAIKSGRLMLERIKELKSQSSDFAFESTLASKSFVPFIQSCRAQGYDVTIIFMWLESIKLAIGRVKDRVSRGGHSIPEAVIKRRYNRSIKNVLNLYVPISHRWIICNNSNIEPKIIAWGDNETGEKFCYDDHSISLMEQIAHEN